LHKNDAFFWGILMDTIKDYFLCDTCKNKNFIKIYTFSTQLRRVDFSDNLIDDEVTEEIYQCTHCNRTFSKHQIATRLKKIKDERLRSLDMPEK
jgi:hypothetical protein